MKPWVLHADGRIDRDTDWWQQVLAWLRANGILDKHLIPEDATLLVAEGYLEAEEFVVDDDGKPVLDDTREDILRRKLIVRLISPPPELPDYVAARAG